MEAGRYHGITNFGMKTLNTLRIEKGYKIWGRELSLNTNPYEAGVGMFIDLEGVRSLSRIEKHTDNSQDEFIGRDACIKLSQETPKRRLELLTVDTFNSKTAKGDIPVGYEVIRRTDSEEVVLAPVKNAQKHINCR